MLMAAAEKSLEKTRAEAPDALALRNARDHSSCTLRRHTIRKKEGGVKAATPRQADAVLPPSW